MLRCYCPEAGIPPGWDLPCPGGLIFLPWLVDAPTAMDDLRSRLVGIGHDQAEGIMASWCDQYGGEWERARG